GPNAFKNDTQGRPGKFHSRSAIPVDFDCRNSGTGSARPWLKSHERAFSGRHGTAGRGSARGGRAAGARSTVARYALSAPSRRRPIRNTVSLASSSHATREEAETAEPFR